MFYPNVTIRRIVRLMPAILIAALAAVGTCRAQTDYRYSILHLPSFGGEDSIAQAIDRRGVVVGFASTPQNDLLAAMWIAAGKPLDLGTLGGRYSVARDISDFSEVVGWSTYPGGSPFDTRATLWKEGVPIDIGTLGGDRSEALAISDVSTIVGWSERDPGSSSQYAFTWSDGNMEWLPGLLSGGIANDLNNAGLIVGQSSNGSAWRAVTWQDGKVRDLGTLRGHGQSWAFGVNDAGYVVGGADIGTRSRNAFVWYDGVMYDLGRLPGMNSMWPQAINNHNQIVGWGTSGYPNLQAFLWEQGRGLMRLDDLIPPRSPWRVYEAWDINDAGQICGNGTRRGSIRLADAFLMTPVHPTMELAAPSPGRAGESNTITVRNVTPGARVTFLYSRHGGGTRIPGCDLQRNALQLDSPTIIGAAIADGNGIATITRMVPPVARNQIILFQAVVQNECAISQLVVHRFE